MFYLRLLMDLVELFGQAGFAQTFVKPIHDFRLRERGQPFHEWHDPEGWFELQELPGY